MILKGVSPLLSPDLLHVLASMGHGDTIVLADANFPAASVAKVSPRRRTDVRCWEANEVKGVLTAQSSLYS